MSIRSVENTFAYWRKRISLLAFGLMLVFAAYPASAASDAERAAAKEVRAAQAAAKSSRKAYEAALADHNRKQGEASRLSADADQLTSRIAELEALEGGARQQVTDATAAATAAAETTTSPPAVPASKRCARPNAISWASTRTLRPSGRRSAKLPAPPSGPSRALPLPLPLWLQRKPPIALMKLPIALLPKRPPR